LQEVDEGAIGSTDFFSKYQWDTLSRLGLVSYRDGTSDAYAQYALNDDLQTLTQSFTGGSSLSFGYTWYEDHQLQSSTVGNPLFQYAPKAGTIDYGTADADNGYTSSKVKSVTTTFTYDGNHNLIFDGSNTLTYDVENRLVQAVNKATSQYLYDPLGHRKQATVGTVVTQFVLEGSTEIADYSGSGTGKPLFFTVPGLGGLPLASVTSPGPKEKIEYYHRDGLGSTVALTEAGSSGTKAHYSYDAFGQTATTSGVPYRFAGYRLDAATGLYYVHARMYSPALGRFLQPDPIGIAGGANLYAYVGNDPINLVDPTGNIGQLGNAAWDTASNHPAAVFGGTAALLGAGICVVVEPCGAIVGGGGLILAGGGTVAAGGTATVGSAVAVTGIVGGTSIAAADLYYNSTSDDAAVAAARGAAADAAANGATGGATSGLVTEGGEIFTGASTRAGGPGMATNPIVQQALDNVPDALQSAYHGCCGEINAASNALNAGASVDGATMATVRAVGNSAGTIMEGCSTCQAVARQLGIRLVSP
jgi:RHS repeat-associated protein